MTLIVASITFLSIFLSVTRSASVTDVSLPAIQYLTRYGYLPNVGFENNTNFEHTVRRAIENFQNFAGLDVTGELDVQTVKQMQRPRCGVKDIMVNGENRSKRYALQGSTWKVKNMTYKVSKYPKNLDQKVLDAEIRRALWIWSEYTDLRFTPSDNNAQIKISFEKGEHGDGDPFDGPGGSLTHAYFPTFGGDAHFDADENWTVHSYRGINIFQVMAHALGHSLGLSHSDITTALMSPFYHGYDPLFETDNDDIEAIQVLYGKKVDTINDTATELDVEKAAPHVDSILCRKPKFDTIFNSASGITYIFKGSQYWKLTNESIVPNYPKLISQGWPGLPDDIDAAFTFNNGKTYFFKGSKYWRYKERKLDGNYPKEISEGFFGIPNNLDAVIRSGRSGKIYFYKGSKYWRFDPTKRRPVQSTYPKPISNWEGVPNDLDAALTWTNGYTYFFKGSGYYRFNDRAFTVDKANPPFPRSTAYWWFGCQDGPQGTIKIDDEVNL